MKKNDSTLKEFRVSLVQEGRNTFHFEEAHKAHGGAIMATRKVLYRLMKAKELFAPRKDFFVIVPPEYQKEGFVPALWFIDAYMNEIKTPYYIGLLSSAALLGAAHQQPQMLQVLTQKQIKPIHKNDIHVQFYAAKVVDKTYLQKYKTPYGYVYIASPELTLLDLFRFPEASGYLNNIATIMLELTDQIKTKEFKHIIDQYARISHIQRLGYMSEYLGLVKIADVCDVFLKTQKRVQVCLLNPYLKYDDAIEFNSKWHLKVNDHIEADV